MAENIYSPSQVTVRATVLPVTVLVSDAHSRLLAIFNNSGAEGELIVESGNVDGSRMQLNDALLLQYNQIKPSLKWHYGYVYKKPSVIKSGVLHAAFKSVMVRPFTKIF